MTPSLHLAPLVGNSFQRTAMIGAVHLFTMNEWIRANVLLPCPPLLSPISLN